MTGDILLLMTCFGDVKKGYRYLFIWILQLYIYKFSGTSNAEAINATTLERGLNISK